MYVQNITKSSNNPASIIFDSASASLDEDKANLFSSFNSKHN